MRLWLHVCICAHVHRGQEGQPSSKLQWSSVVNSVDYTHHNRCFSTLLFFCFSEKVKCWEQFYTSKKSHKNERKLSKVAHACNSREAEAGGLGIKGHPWYIVSSELAWAKREPGHQNNKKVDTFHIRD